MQCDSASEMLDAYLDGELSPNMSAAVDEHVKGCARCSSQIAETARLHHALRAGRGHFAPSAEFRRRIQKQIAPSRRRSWLLVWVPVASTMATVLLLVFLFLGQRKTSDALAEIADLHVNALSSANQVDVTSTDRHTVKPWFQGRIPFTFNLPEFSGTDYTLVGGRMVYFHQQPGAQLIVSMRQHRISVLIFQHSAEIEDEFPRTSAVDRRTSFGIEAWQSKELCFFLISDADPSGIDKLAQMLKEANP